MSGTVTFPNSSGGVASPCNTAHCLLAILFLNHRVTIREILPADRVVAESTQGNSIFLNPSINSNASARIVNSKPELKNTWVRVSEQYW
jgi:hypothetical protein